MYNGLPGGKWEGKSHEMFPIFAEKTPDTRKFSFSDIFSKQRKKQQLIRKYLTLMFPIFAQEIPDIQPIILTQLSFHTTNRGRVGIFPLHLIRSKGKHVWDALVIFYNLQQCTFYASNPTPRNALSVRWSVRWSRFLPPSNAHAHQSDL